MRLYYLISVLAVMPAMAQTHLLTFGVEGGMPAQTPLGQSGSRMPFVVGPTVNIHLSPRLSLETGFLYHWMGKGLTTGVLLYPVNSVTLLSGTAHAHAFELPFLARYHFLDEHRGWRPFVNAGPSVRRTTIEDRQSTSVLSSAPAIPFLLPGLNATRVKWNVDPSVGAGVDFKTGRFHLEPEVRYSYWGAGKSSVVRKNQVSLMLGFRF